MYLGTGTLTLHDISKDGRVLFSRDDWRSGIAGAGPDGKERDLSWHDWTVARDISDDGHLGYVHAAQLHDVSLGRSKALVKIFPSYSHGIINEIAGYLLAHARRIPQASNASTPRRAQS